MNDSKSICDECGSEYFTATSEMKKLCPNCSHYLYGYKNCNHKFENGRCAKCFWDGSASAYVESKKK